MVICKDTGLRDRKTKRLTGEFDGGWKWRKRREEEKRRGEEAGEEEATTAVVTAAHGLSKNRAKAH